MSQHEKPAEGRDPTEAAAFVFSHHSASELTCRSPLLRGPGSSAASTGRFGAVLEDLEAWPRWSLLHHETKCLGTAGLAVGGQFIQRLDLRFPAATPTETVTITFSEPGRQAGWAGSNPGICSSQVWWPLVRANDGAAHVSNVEAFLRLPAAPIKPLVTRRWRGQFQATVDGMVDAATG